MLPQNAYPFGEIPPELKDYFSLGPDGKPVKNTINPSDFKPPNEAEWETKDYVDLPPLITV